jgi:uncharacterized membrane protein (DUF4010 family)
MNGLPQLSPLLLHFGATALLSFIIGLELHSYRRAIGTELGYGTTRTITLIGIFGFALWTLDPMGTLFYVGMATLGGWLGIYYWRRSQTGDFSLLTSLVAILTYLLGPIGYLLPEWFLVLYVVILIVMLGAKPVIRRFSDTFRSEEFVTLVKFLVLAGIILPLLPARPISPFMGVTYYQVWLAVVVVSGISYLSYLIQAYFFPEAGLAISGILGGLYSSTATTVALARKARVKGTSINGLNPALLLATAMMYLRLWVIILALGYREAASSLTLPFGALAAFAILISLFLARKTEKETGKSEPLIDRHPLELPTAFLFAFLFVFFAALTQYVTGHFGKNGLQTLSFVVGFSDIDPFILSLLAGKFSVDQRTVVSAVIIATGSNNVLKAVYASLLTRRREVLPASVCLTALALASFLYVLVAL